MKRNVLFAIFLLGLAALAIACGPAPEGAAAQAAALEPQEQTTPVEVATVQTGDIALIYNYAGDLRAERSVNVLPGAAGRIEAVLIEVGDEVQAGQPLARVESDLYTLQLKQAQAALASAQLNLAKMKQGTRPEQIAAAEAAVEVARASLNDVTTISDDERTVAATALAQAEAALRIAQAEYDKIAWAGQVGLTPQALQLEQATVAYESAVAAYNLQTHPSDSQLAPLLTQLVQAELSLILAKQPFTELDFKLAEVGVEQASVAVDLAQLQLDEAAIEAPFDGVVSEVFVTEGSMVGPQAPVASLISQDVEVVVQVEESRIGQIFPGQNASLQVTAFPGQDFPAVVTRVAPAADSATRTFAVTIMPVDEERLLRSGMFANVSILIDEKEATLIAPRAAVTLVNDQEIVYVVNGDTVEQRPVTTGLFDKNRIEILTGLEEGEVIVIAGQANLIEGARIEITN
ncbi:MAG: efflux RND transporter periplasmic adaptor subunit [Anaerolineae bacterium]